MASIWDALGIAAILNRGKQLDRIEQKVDWLMAQVAVDQEVLNTIGEELGNIGDAVQAIVDDPGNPLEEGDLTVITEPLSRIKDILPHPDQSLPE
jgi:hypothetical protein